MDLLLHWTQAVCYTQNLEVHSYSSLTDGRALTCLIKFYFGNDINQLVCEKENEAYNDVFRPCDIFDEDAYFDERSAVIVLVFLASRLINADKLDIMNSFRLSQQASQISAPKRASISRLLHLHSGSPRSRKNLKGLFSPHNKEGFATYSPEEIIHKIKRIQMWWRGLRERRKYLQLKCAASIFQAFVRCNLARRRILESSARIIQTRYRGFIKRSYFLKMKMSTILLQSVVKAWLTARSESHSEYGRPASSVLPSSNGKYDRYLTFFIERWRFYRTRKSVILIQRFVRAWIQRKHPNVKFMYSKINASEIPGEIVLSSSSCHVATPRHFTVLDDVEKQSTTGAGNTNFELQWRAATKIQESWKTYVHNMHLKRCCSAIKIQSQWRCWSIRQKYLCQVEAIKIIQSTLLSLMNHEMFQQKHIAAIEIQRFIRGHLARTNLLGASNLRVSMLQRRSFDVINDGLMNNFELRIQISSIIKLQRWWKRLLLNRCRMHAAISIQSSVRGWIARRASAKRKRNISRIQRLWRKILVSRMMKSSVLVIQACIRGWITRLAAAHKKCCILKIQRWWRNILFLKARKTSVSIIQAHVRGWIARQKVAQNKHDIVLIQCYWKGYQVRKQCRPQLLNLRQRMQLSSANVSDEMRLINRLVVALSELLGHKNVSNIRHTCATLDRATEVSQKCCETLVEAGAVGILLKQIKLLNRGIPDQEVLKHVLSIFFNIARYNHLSLLLINTPRSIDMIFQEMLRNKNEGFIISGQLLRRLCAIPEGLQAVCKLRGHVKRLNNVILELERKVKFLDRNSHQHYQRNLTVTRLREAISLMSLIVDGH